jgi:RimJ/RimL family protein N-acetyltransferase
MLTGTLVTLRAITPADYDVLYEIAADLDTWEQRNPRPPGTLNRAEWEERFSARLKDPEAVEFGIEADGTLVGSCVLMHLDLLARNAEVGIALGAGARGRGYGTDALRVLAEFSFTRRNLHRIHLQVLAANAGAIASYRKVGFVEEGRRREHAWVRGHYVDDVVMGLLHSDWRIRTPPAVASA